MPLSYELEILLWKRALRRLIATDSRKHRVAKLKLRDLENINDWDAPQKQNWLSGVMWMARKNASIKLAYDEVYSREKIVEDSEAVDKVVDTVDNEAEEPKRGRGRPKLSDEEKAKRQAERKAQKDKEREIAKAEKAEAKRKEFLDQIENVGKPKFGSFNDMKSHWIQVSASRTDHIVLSSCLVMEKDANGLLMKVHAPTAPGTAQNLEPGAYRMLPVGEVTFCKRLGMSYNYFSKYPQDDEIVEHMNTLNRAAEKEWAVRIIDDGKGEKKVQGVLPKKFQAIDHADVYEALEKYDPTLFDFVEGSFDKAVDLTDLTFKGLAEEGDGKYYPALRVVNSEVDMSPLMYSMGLTDGQHFYISLARGRGGVKVPHRGKAGDIADWLVLEDMVKRQDGLKKALGAAEEVSLDANKMTQFLVDKLGIVSKDAGGFLDDYFVANPGDGTLLAYVNGMLDAGRVFTVAKMNKLSDTAMSILFRDIPVIN